MNRNIYTIAILLFSLIFVSCGDDDDEIDYEWKSMNENAYNTAFNGSEYTRLWSASKDAQVLWKESEVLTDHDLSTTFALKTTPYGTPEYTDSVSVRYKGWYYLKDGSKYVFDTTEYNETTGVDYNGTPRSFAVKGVIDGWSTALQDMTEGEEREIIIPWKLGYGASKSGGIPAYTTLYFNVRLLKILPMTGRN